MKVLPMEVLEQATKRNALPIVPVSPANGNGAGEKTNTIELPSHIASDARPDPKPRKYPHLWQAYLWWYELMEMRKRHLLRISSIKRGKSNLDSQFELDMLQLTQMDTLLKNTKKIMKNYGSTVPVWKWVTGIKGLGGECGLAAQLIAQIDDIEKFDTVAALWRFAGYAVFDGKAEKNQKGEKSHFNRKLKGVCFNIADQFIKQQTPGYVDIYYAEKERQRLMNPEPICLDCNAPAQSYQKKDNKTGNYVTGYRCPGKKKEHTVKYSDDHIHHRAWRKMIKAFLCDLWVEWKKPGS